MLEIGPDLQRYFNVFGPCPDQDRDTPGREAPGSGGDLTAHYPEAEGDGASSIHILRKKKAGKKLVAGALRDPLEIDEAELSGTLGGGMTKVG